MASNKKKRDELQLIYGEGSMFEKSRCEEYIATLPKIKGYKRFIKEKRFTTKEIRKLTHRMNYHHLEHKADGGATNVENGAVVNELEHRYIHSLPRNQEEIINNHIRQWKADFIAIMGGQVIDSQEIDINLNEDVIEIPVHNMNIKHNLKYLEEKRRRQEKQELQKLKKEYEER
jgi:hypothetical protein